MSRFQIMERAELAKKSKYGSAFLQLDAQHAGNPTELRKAQSKFRQACNARTFAGAFMGANPMLDDDVVREGASNLARELEEVLGRTLPVEYAPNNLMQNYPIERGLRPGQTEFRRKAKKHTGRADFYEPGQPINTVNVEYEDKVYPILPVAVSMRFSLFDRFGSGLAGTTLESDLRSAMREAIPEFLNDEGFYGTRLPSLLNYASLDKTYTGIEFGAGSSDSNETIIAEVVGRANAIYSDSNQVFSSTRIDTSVRVAQFLTSTPYSALNKESLADAIKRLSNGRITEIRGMHELRGRGPSGRDAMLFVRPEIESVSIVMGGDFNLLPLDNVNGLEFSQVAYAMYGGINMRRPDNNKLVWVKFVA